MRTSPLLTLLLSGLALGNVVLRQNSTSVGPVNTLVCSGAARCSRTGSTGTLWVDAGSTGPQGPPGDAGPQGEPGVCTAATDAGFTTYCSGGLTCSSDGGSAWLSSADTYAVVACPTGQVIIGIDAGTAYCALPGFVKACASGQFILGIDSGTAYCGETGFDAGAFLLRDISCTGATCWIDGGVLFLTVP